MKSFWNYLPEQIRRLSILVLILITVFILLHSILVPSDFGTYGHYRASAVEEIIL